VTEDSPRTFIVTATSAVSDAELVQQLQAHGLDVDADYGVVPIDPRRGTRVLRVRAAETKVRRASEALGFMYYPDLGVGP
jgi:hypothetical protein